MATSLSVAEVRAQIPGDDRLDAIYRALPGGWLGEREMRAAVTRIAGLREWDSAAAGALLASMEVAGLLLSRVSDVPNVGKEFSGNPDPPEPVSFQDAEAKRIAAQAEWERGEREREAADRTRAHRQLRETELAFERAHIHGLIDERLKELGIHPEHTEPALAGS